MVEALARSGAQGIIAGCTEIGMLLRPSDVALPLFDITELHARAAVELALSP